MGTDIQSLLLQRHHSPRPTPVSQPLAPAQLLEARSKLIHALQMSLAPDEILAIFFHHVQAWVALGGIQFKFSNDQVESRLGRTGLHHSDYRLNTDDDYLGQISFSRSKRFTEDELATLEMLIGSLVYPLRNALRYQDALKLALQDALTGLGNRVALDNALHRELQLAERHQQQFSLLMIDIDHFKKINDKYGHSHGDRVLREVTETVKTVCRETDLTFRYGGEEFVVLLRETGEAGALIIAERIRLQIAKLKIGNDADCVSPTVSIGIGTREFGKKEQISDLFDRADQALYLAKANGRNCTINLRTAG